MPLRKFIFFCLLLVLGISFYYLSKSSEVSKSSAKESSPDSSSTSPLGQGRIWETTAPQSRAQSLLARTRSSEPNLDSRIIRYTDDSSDLTAAIQISKKLHQGESPSEDLEIVSQILFQYRFLYEENPVGVENFEFTAALTGDNPQRINFIDPKSSALSSNNEMIDRWGSPFVFHPLSGNNMELRSLGPDKTLWTEDDLTLSVAPTNPKR